MEEKEFSWRRCLAWTFAIGGHAALLVALSVTLGPGDPPTAVVDEAPAWIDNERATRVALPLPRAAGGVAPSTRRDEALAADPLERAPSPLDAPVARPLSMLDDHGRPRLPLEPLFAASAPLREGDYYTPGDGSEDDVFDRPLALEPATTRFERVWAQPQTLGGEWYGRLVRATTGIVRIPLNPKFTLVCGVSIAGLGGGCGIARVTGSGVVVERSGDPPPWERSNRVQCRELRDQLAVAADTERVAFLLDRLAALCVEADASSIPSPETTKPGAGPGSGA